MSDKTKEVEATTESKPKINMSDVLRPEHAKTLSKLSILFANLSSEIRIADTYQDVKDAVLNCDKEMELLSADFDELEECLKPGE